MKTNKKKMIAGILSLSLLLAAAAVPALAEGPAAGSAVTAAKGGPGRDGGNRNTRQGQMPGGRNQPRPGAQAPAENGTSPDQQQTPEQGTAESGQNTQGAGGNTITGGQPGRRNGRGGRGTAKIQEKTELQLKSLVEKNVIDQETADKIAEYLKQNMPADPKSNQNTAGDASQPQDGQATAEGAPVPGDPQGNPPTELPEGAAAPEGGSGTAGSDPLAGLVEAGVLTQEQADAVNAVLGGGEMPADESGAIDG